MRRQLHIDTPAKRHPAPRRRHPAREGVPYALLENAPFPAWVSTAKGVLRFLNRTFRDAAPELGSAGADVFWRSVVHSDDLKTWDALMASAAPARGLFKIELRILTPDKGVRWFLVNAEPLMNGNRLQGYWGTAIDVTPQKRQDRASRSSDDRFRTLADLGGSCVVAMDNDLRVVAWNGNAALVSGIAPTTAIGRRIETLPGPLGGVDIQRLCSLAQLEKRVIDCPEGSGIHGGSLRLHWQIYPSAAGPLLVGKDQSPDLPATCHAEIEFPRRILEHAQDIAALQDPEGRYLFFHGPSSLGLSAVEVTGKLPHEFLPGELAGQIVRRVREVCESGEEMNDESTLEWKGRQYMFEDRLTPVRGDGGKTIGVVTVSHDVTLARQAEDQLRLSERRHRSFFEQSIEGIWRLTLRPPLTVMLPVEAQVDALLRTGVIAECNDAMARMSGYSGGKELVGAPLTTFLNPASVDHRQFLRAFVEGGYRVDRTETREIDRSGSPRYFLSALVGSVVDGELREAWGSRSEITQRRLADREMRLLAQTITSAKDCISITDLQDTILFVNEAFLTTYGYGEDELVGEQISIVRSARNSGLGEGEILRRSLEGGWNGELINRRKDGSEFPIELWTSVVRNEEGNPVAIVGVARDITERHRKDEQIRASLHEKEVLLQEIHHRVKNNLQVISSLLSLQGEYIEDPETLRFFRESQNRVRSMALIHEKLYQSSNLARVEFDAYLKELSGQLLRSYAPRGRAVGLQLDAQPVSLGIDRAIPCGIILNELVTNALKYAFPGEYCGRVFVGCSMDRTGMVRLVVGDDGVGLPDGFDVRTSDTLGLKLVNMLCDQLQASLNVAHCGASLGASSGVEFVVTFSATAPATGAVVSEEGRG